MYMHTSSERQKQSQVAEGKMESQKVEEVTEPVSPVGQYFSSSVLSICVLGVLEMEVPIDDLPTLPFLKDVFLPINPRLSSIMAVDQDGVKNWKSVEVHLQDHVNVPIFPAEMSLQFYDKCVHDYLSELAVKPLPQSRPLWEVHIIKYPTTNAAGTVILKLHHALGDGFSLIGALLSCLQRADDPSLPLTFPSVQVRSDDNGGSILNKVPKFLSTIANSASDLCQSIFKSTFGEDDPSPIRSDCDGCRPMTISSMTFPLHQIKLIKDNLGATVNDVITGIIFLGSRLYMLEERKESVNSRSTAVVVLNTRMFRSYCSVEEMVKPDAKSPWGNHFTFLHVPLPKLADAKLENPLEFIKKAQETIKSKRNSLGVFLTASLLDFVNKVRGPEGAANYVRNSMKNSSMLITNVIGPVEKMSLANHPIKGLYFSVSGVPVSVLLTILSYMGNLRVTIGAEDGFIDAPKLKSCIENAFDIIFNAIAKN